MYRHDNRLLRDTVAKFRRILPVFCGKGLDDLGPMPVYLYQCKNNCESCQEKIVFAAWDRIALRWEGLLLSSPKKPITDYFTHLTMKTRFGFVTAGLLVAIMALCYKTMYIDRTPQAIYDKDKKALEEAKAINTPEIFQKLMDNNPKSAWTKNFIYFRDRAALNLARQQNTIKAYQQFIDSYPNSVLLDTARWYQKQHPIFGPYDKHPKIQTYEEKKEKQASGREQKSFLGALTPRIEARTINSIESLKTFVKRGQQQGYFPKKIVRASGTHSQRLEQIDFNFKQVIEWDINSKCSSRTDQVILAYSHANNSIVCENSDSIIIMGSGNDWLKTHSHNHIIVPGKGDDVVKSEGGSNLFIFQPGWGHDTITTSSKEIDTAKIAGYDGSYPYRFTSFLIFDQGIARRDLVWEDNTILNTKTGDSITLHGIDKKKITLLFAEKDHESGIDTQFILERHKEKAIPLSELRAVSVTLRDNIGYYAQGDEGLAIVDLSDIEQPRLLSQLILPGSVTNVQLDKKLAFVAQRDVEGVGKKGWVSIIDISDLRKPRLLSDIAFHNAIYNVAIDNGRLFVPDTHFFRGFGNLHIFDVSRPKKPKLLSATVLSHYAKFIAYLDNRVYLPEFSDNGVTVFDVARADRPKLVGNYRHFSKNVRAIKSAGGKLVVNQIDSLFSVSTPDAIKGITESCRVVTTEQPETCNPTDYDAIFVVGDHIFHAEGKNGVSITKMESDGTCNKKQQIAFKGEFIHSLYVVQDTLVAFDGKNKANLVRLGLFSQAESSAVAQKASPDPARRDEEDIPHKDLSQDQLQTLLYQAAEDDDGEKVAALCQAGANPNLEGHEKDNAVEISAGGSKLRALESLLRHGGNPQSNNGKSMTLAALHEQLEAMKLLQKFGGNIGQADADGCSTMHYLAHDGTLDMIKYLVENGVPIDSKCRGKETPLSWARGGGNEAVVNYLESMGAK